MEWAVWQAGVSAELDGEDPGIDRAELRAFEAANPRAADWLAAAHRLNRVTRLQQAPRPLPEGFTQAVLAGAPAPVPPTGEPVEPGESGEPGGEFAGKRRGRRVAAGTDGEYGGDPDHRPAVVALRAGILALALVASLGAAPYLVLALRLGDQVGAQWASVSLSAAAALLYAALRPGRCGPMCVLLSVAGVLAATASAVGVVTGRTSWNLEAHHLAWFLGAFLVGVLSFLRRPRARSTEGDTWPRRGPVGTNR